MMIPFQNRAARVGYLLGLSFAMVRVLSASTVADLLLTVALTLMEMGIVYLLELRFHGQTLSAAATAMKNDLRQVAEDRVSNEQGLFDKRQLDLATTDRSIQDLLNNIEADHLRSDLKALINIGTKAAASGYERGVAATQGVFSGVEGEQLA